MAGNMIEMSPETLATAMGNRVTRERNRIAKRIEEFAAAQVTNDDLLRGSLYALAEEIRGPASPTPQVVATPPTQQFNAVDDDPPEELPPVRHMDDFTEGVALVQGAMHRRGLTGYMGATGNLRGPGFPTD